MIGNQFIEDIATYIDIEKKWNLSECRNEIVELFIMLDRIRNKCIDINNARRIDNQYDSSVDDLLKSIDCENN